MPATVDLSTTSLVKPISAWDSQIVVASTSGLTTGKRLYADRELMSVVSVDSSSQVTVRRGVDSTLAAPHASSMVCVIGDADQFFSYDPQGMPKDAVLVSPHINVRTGDIWLAQGDVSPEGNSARWWEKVQVKYDVGALGIRSVTSSPSSGT